MNIFSAFALLHYLASVAREYCWKMSTSRVAVAFLLLAPLIYVSIETDIVVTYYRQCSEWVDRALARNDSNLLHSIVRQRRRPFLLASGGYDGDDGGDGQNGGESLPLFQFSEPTVFSVFMGNFRSSHQLLYFSAKQRRALLMHKYEGSVSTVCVFIWNK